MTSITDKEHSRLCRIAEVNAEFSKVDEAKVQASWAKLTAFIDKENKPLHMKPTDDFSDHGDDFGKASFRYGVALGAIVTLVVCLATTLLLIQAHVIQIIR